MSNSSGTSENWLQSATALVPTANIDQLYQTSQDNNSINFDNALSLGKSPTDKWLDDLNNDSNFGGAKVHTDSKILQKELDTHSLDEAFKFDVFDKPYTPLNMFS